MSQVAHLSFPKKPGIYKVTNLLNSKVYIGQSKDLRRRVRNHYQKMKNGIHKNEHLNFSVAKYGISSFIFEIVEILKESQLTSREQYWMDFYESYNRTKGYNRNPIAESNKNRKEAPESTQKRAAKLAQPFRVYSPDGVLYEGKNRKTFALSQNLSISNFNDLINGKRRACSGWTTNLRDNFTLKEFGVDAFYKLPKFIYQARREGLSYSAWSIKELASKTPISTGSINNALRTNKTVKGWSVTRQGLKF